MSALAPCAACQLGNHVNHVEHWLKAPEGVLGGAYCGCKGDCKPSVDFARIFAHVQPCRVGFNGPCPERAAALDLNERRQTTLRALAALDEPDRLTVLDQIAWDNPDAVTDALNETGHRHE